MSVLRIFVACLFSCLLALVHGKGDHNEFYCKMGPGLLFDSKCDGRSFEVRKFAEGKVIEEFAIVLPSDYECMVGLHRAKDDEGTRYPCFWGTPTAMSPAAVRESPVASASGANSSTAASSENRPESVENRSAAEVNTTANSSIAAEVNTTANS